MVNDRSSWRMKARHAALVLTTALLSLTYFDGAAVHAQSIMRSPSINIGSRIPSIDTNIAGRLDVDRTGPRLRPTCSFTYRNSDGGCADQPVTSVDGGGSNGPGSKIKSSGPRRIVPQTTLDLSTVAGQLVAEIDGSLTDAQADALARRHGLARLGSQNFPLIGSTIGLFRVIDRRPVLTVSRELATETSVRSVQPNFRYLLQDQKAALTEGDPAQYAVAKLRLPEAHTLARGTNVIIAVIDSGIDVRHPELANAIADASTRSAARKVPTSTAPALPARSCRTGG
jgi:hypothetical protein